jgi:hypothetical protein
VVLRANAAPTFLLGKERKGWYLARLSKNAGHKSLSWKRKGKGGEGKAKTQKSSKKAYQKSSSKKLIKKTHQKSSKQPIKKAQKSSFKKFEKARQKAHKKAHNIPGLEPGAANPDSGLILH